MEEVAEGASSLEDTLRCPWRAAGPRRGVGGRWKAGHTTFRVQLEMSFCPVLAGQPSSGHTDSRASSFKPKCAGSNPAAGTF